MGNIWISTSYPHIIHSLIGLPKESTMNMVQNENENESVKVINQM